MALRSSQLIFFSLKVRSDLGNNEPKYVEYVENLGDHIKYGNVVISAYFFTFSFVIADNIEFSFNMPDSLPRVA